MAKFQFRLQSILGIKEKLEEQKKLEYGQALAKVELEKQIKTQLQIEKGETISFFRDSVNSRIEPEKLSSYNNYIELLKKKLSSKTGQLKRRSLMPKRGAWI